MPIYNARIGVSTKGCTMYLSCGIPCCDCVKRNHKSVSRESFVNEVIQLKETIGKKITKEVGQC